MLEPTWTVLPETVTPLGACNTTESPVAVSSWIAPFELVTDTVCPETLPPVTLTPA
jgi:hypothetical protein